MGVLPKKLFDVELLATGNSDTGEKFTYNIFRRLIHWCSKKRLRQFPPQQI
jgi:hypothetical protein